MEEFRTIHSRYLNSMNCVIEVGKINIIKSLTGTGKTTLLSSFINSNQTFKCLALSHRRTLAMFLSEKLQFINYMNVDIESLITASNYKIVVSMESLYRYKKNDGAIPIPDLLILDEFCSIIEHYSSSTMNRAKRSLFTEIICHFIRNQKTTVVISDAYFTDRDLDMVRFIAEGANKKIVLTDNTFRESVKQCRIYRDSRSFHDDIMKDLMSCISEEPKRLYICSNSKEQLLGLYSCFKKEIENKASPEQLAEILEKTAIICAETTDEQKEFFSYDLGQSWSTTDRIFCTPTITAGVSFDELHFHKVYGIATNNSTSPRSFLQQLNRVRNTILNKTCVLIPNDIGGNENEDKIDFFTVLNDFSLVKAWIGKVYNDVINIRYEEKDDCLVPVIVRNDINNKLIINNIVNTINYRANFGYELMNILESDWFEIKEVGDTSNSHMATVYRKSSRQYKREQLANQAVNPDSHNTMVLPEQRKCAATQESIINKVLTFYNMFPTIPLHYRTGYKLYRKKTSAFINRFDINKHERFEQILLLRDVKVLLTDEGAQENLLDPISITHLRNVILKLLYFSGVLKKEDLFMPRKIQGEWKKEFNPSELEIHENSQIFTSFYIYKINEDLQTREFFIDEEVIRDNWNDFFDTYKYNENVLRSVIKTSVIKSPYDQKSISNSTKLVCSLLSYMGINMSIDLDKKKKPVSVTNIRHNKKRLRLRRYKLYDINDRFFLSLLRYMSKPDDDIETTYLLNVIEDPYQLFKITGEINTDLGSEYYRKLQQKRRRGSGISSIYRICNLEFYNKN